MRQDEAAWGLLCDSEYCVLIRCRCRGYWERLTRWTLAVNSVANASFHIHMISVHSASAQATHMKVKIEPSFTKCARATLACPKTPQ